MTEPALGFGIRLVRYMAKAIDGPKRLGRYLAIVTLSVVPAQIDLFKQLRCRFTVTIEFG
jgi:hypothetical protein